MITPAELLGKVQTIAIVGLSAKPGRASYDVAGFLADRGYNCVGINPTIAGISVRGIPVVASLAEVDRPIDMVDIFRDASALPSLLGEILALSPRPWLIWTQLGVEDLAVKARAEAAGLNVVMNACPKIVLTQSAH